MDKAIISQRREMLKKWDKILLNSKFTKKDAEALSKKVNEAGARYVKEQLDEIEA